MKQPNGICTGFHVRVGSGGGQGYKTRHKDTWARHRAGDSGAGDFRTSNKDCHFDRSL